MPIRISVPYCNLQPRPPRCRRTDTWILRCILEALNAGVASLYQQYITYSGPWVVDKQTSTLSRSVRAWRPVLAVTGGRRPASPHLSVLRRDLSTFRYWATAALSHNRGQHLPLLADGGLGEGKPMKGLLHWNEAPKDVICSSYNCYLEKCNGPFNHPVSHFCFWMKSLHTSLAYT